MNLSCFTLLESVGNAGGFLLLSISKDLPSERYELSHPVKMLLNPTKAVQSLRQDVCSYRLLVE
jgi:hypothetical protein